MQISIIFGILYNLISHRSVSRVELAEKFEISTRTVTRYISYLSICGVPVYITNGPSGGYCLPDDYTLERTYLTQEERMRIINSLSATKTGFADSLNDHISQKLTALATDKNDNFMINSETLIIDAGAWNNPHEYKNKIQALSRAIDLCLSVKFNYIDRHEYSTQRCFDPHCLVLKEGIWYVYGYCHTRNDFRLFKVSRINDPIITDEKFARRKFDVYAKLKGNFDNNELVDFTIEFSNMILPDIEEWLGLGAISERGTKYIARAQLYGGNVLLAKLLSFGSSIKVLYPPQLKEELLTECKRILEINN